MTNNHISSPGLRIRSPSAKAKSNIAISRGDDDSSIDDGRVNNKMCISDETTIKCVFNKKRLFGGTLAFVAVVLLLWPLLLQLQLLGPMVEDHHLWQLSEAIIS